MARTQRPARSRPLSHLTRDSTLGALIADDPTPRRAARSREPALRWDDVRGRSREVPRRPRELPRRSQGASATPTLTMLALGARVAFWTTWFIVVGFLVLLIAL